MNVRAKWSSAWYELDVSRVVLLPECGSRIEVGVWWLVCENIDYPSIVLYDVGIPSFGIILAFLYLMFRQQYPYPHLHR